jgi:hypothetical protein
MYIKDLADKTGVDQTTLEQFIKSKGYEITSIFGVTSIENSIAERIEKEIKEIQKINSEEKNYLFVLLKCNKENPLDVYYIIVKHLYVKGVLFTIQDFIISNKDDSYDLTSYKLDLIVPIYDGYGRIMREGVLFDSEYVLFVAYSIKTKDGIEEKNSGLIHVFNGDNGGFAYIERDEKNIYEKKMSEMVDKNGKSIIEVLTSLLEPDATANLIDKAKAELTQQIKKEQAQATGEAIGASIGAAILGASAANLGRSVRQFGRSI